MSELERYTKRVYGNIGLLRQRNLAVLRNYLRTSTEETIKRQVIAIMDINLLKILWEAGIKAELQEIVLRQYDLLRERSL